MSCEYGKDTNVASLPASTHETLSASTRVFRPFEKHGRPCNPKSGANGSHLLSHLFEVQGLKGTVAISADSGDPMGGNLDTSPKHIPALPILDESCARYDESCARVTYHISSLLHETVQTLHV